MSKINLPVLLLTGYLGSGKTTLLNRILSNKRGIRFAVIVNDIGEVNIDASLIQKGGIVDQQDDSLVALQNGCICCTLKMDLVQQIQDIIEMQRFDYLVIEASGICEPAPIAQTICSMQAMAEPVTRYGIPELDCIVTVVDALRMKDEFQSGEGLMNKHIGEEDIENLVIQQIEFCNIILLNKASEVDKHELERIRQIIRALQPKAEIIECDYGNVDLDRLLHTGSFDFNRVATSAAWIDEIENHHGDEEDHEDEHEEHHHHEDEHEEHHHHEDEHEEHHHHHHHHHHDDEGEAEEYGIGTFVYYRRQPFDLGRFDHFVARKWPSNIIRAKGICYFKGEEDTCYLFEQAGKQVGLQNAGQWYATMPKEELEAMLNKDAGLRRDWDEQYGDRMQKLVFIGQHLNKESITQLLDECLMN
ncbi:MAG: GTP-binding protein [Paraprevotella sp.]|nr:GTP-binding protein [Paraprevotella sp.]MDY5266042.1 GTP-binding protein [Bacteroidaceae bacterium]